MSSFKCNQRSNSDKGDVELCGVDLEKFAAEIEAVRKKAYATVNSDDYQHMRRVELRGRLATLVGYLTGWVAPNPISALAISLGQNTRWMLAHHIIHQGYDRIPGIPTRYTSRGFARGWRRIVDWFDWMLPKAWEYEHNILHHGNVGEDMDPDVIERHLKFLRKSRIPLSLKYLFLALLALTWKFTYYAPRTMSVLDPHTMSRRRGDRIMNETIINIIDLGSPTVRALWTRSYIPYVSFHFLLIPILFLPLGITAAINILLNRLVAELITNVHSFVMISPNHTADDLYRYEDRYKRRDKFYIAQVLSSANYRCGNERIDFISLWLNYQIEHHLIPDLPMSKYREIQPIIKSICQKYGLPYRQESIVKRFKRMARVATGQAGGLTLKWRETEVTQEWSKIAK